MIKQLQEAAFERDKEWDPKGVLDLPFRAVELAGEVGEACNIVKKLEREYRGLRGTRSSREALAEELGDVVICVALLANCVQIDLEQAVKDKFNASSTKMGLSVFL